jgi:Fe-S-cluster-containing dehydrogenase component
VGHIPKDFDPPTGNRAYHRSQWEPDGHRHAPVPSSGRTGELPAGSVNPAAAQLDALSRRRFLNLISASAALALGTGSCSKIDRGKIVPYTGKPEEVVPGVATYYASTFQEGLVTEGVLVKTREGRPILVEGNAEHTISRGKISLRAMADVLGLYDPDRLRRPSEGGAPSTWEKADQEIAEALRAVRDAGAPFLLLTEALISPTRRALIEELRAALPSLRHAAWEAAAPQPEIAASRTLYGEALMPRLRFDRAEVILSLQDDFLGTNSNAPAFIRDFAARRGVSSPGDSMNRLWVIEGCMTLTGANADQRLQARPSQIAPLAFALARILNDVHGVPLPRDLNPESLRSFDPEALANRLGIKPGVLPALAEDLKRAGRSALVLAGASLPPEAHVACHLLNNMLGAEGHTVDTEFAVPGPEPLTFAGLRELLDEAARGTFPLAFFWGTNPGYSYPDAAAWKNAVANIPLKIRIGLYEDETALACRWRLPEHHWLEAWGDFEPSADLLSLRQPTIGAIHDSRQGEDILLSCLRALGRDVPPTYLEYLRTRWQREVYPAGSPVSFELFWNAALHDGVLRREPRPGAARAARTGAFLEAMGAASASRSAGAGEALELVLLPGTTVYDGRYANNGWLNELPDPVTKGTWGNPLLISVSDAKRFGLEDGDVVAVSSGAASLEVPILIQPGQAQGVVGLALGLGRRTGNVATGVGVNAFPLLDVASASPNLRSSISVVRTGRSRAIPRTQEHSRMEDRDPARSWTLREYAREAGNSEEDKHGHEVESLIPPQEFIGHKWGMVIDLSACVGCSTCVIACQAENNIPVVGPERILAGRQMQWIRIDRYYEGDPSDPSVVHQPLLCQHCDDAPCEIVCPVNATTHSPDGLNQMAYNRCVGTRYCSNNCPFKVRRFNFFDYTSMKKEPEKLVFNPEVTVRPRGVMEKCSFCIQRIQDVRQRANVEGRPVRDGEITPACAAACPAEAIVFGDVNDPQSRVSKMAKIDRGYRMLEELAIKPSITYLADISNPSIGEGKA